MGLNGMMQSRFALPVAIALFVLLSGCGQSPDSTTQTERVAVGFHDYDECHVCGMAITQFPGPKGQAYVTRVERPLKFCSVREMFGWLLQPDTTAIVQEIYVHDMADNDWQHPDDASLIDARSAWYVAGSSRRGAMGPTLASFARADAAQAFAVQYGGDVLRFNDITLAVMQATAVVAQ